MRKYKQQMDPFNSHVFIMHEKDIFAAMNIAAIKWYKLVKKTHSPCWWPQEAAMFVTLSKSVLDLLNKSGLDKVSFISKSEFIVH